MTTSNNETKARRQAIATNEGMAKGYWKVVLTDGTLIYTSLSRRKTAAAFADEINQRGCYYDAFAKQVVDL
jgi:hypothetical protein